MFKKFKEKVYLKIFEKFKDQSNPGAEMLAALTVNALRELNAEQRYKLALDMGTRIDLEQRRLLVREILDSMLDNKFTESLFDKLLLRQMLFRRIDDKVIADKLDDVIRSLYTPTHTI